MSSLSTDSMAVDSPPPSAFVQLPRELLDGIAGFLPTSDFNNLRLSCKHVENTLFPYWANCFFRARQFMMTDFSLNTLLDISRHPVLSKHLTHLAIGLDDLGQDFHELFAGFASYDDMDWYNSASASQKTLFDTGEAVRILSAALVNLPNLGYIDIRDYSSSTRYRDGGQWNSYGSSVHRNWRLHGSRNSRIPQHALQCYTTRIDFTSRVFKVLIAALHQASSSCPVRRLDVITKGSSVGLDDHAFALVRAPDTGLRAILGGLTTLHLNLTIQTRVYHTIPPTMHHIATQTDYNLCTVHLQRFLALTPNLTWLRLNSKSIVDGMAVLDFFRWLALQPGDTLQEPTDQRWQAAPVEPIALPLTRLDLGSWRLPTQLWISLLRKFNGLVHLSLFKTFATTDTAQYPDRNPLWATLIRQLPDLTPELQLIELFHVGEGGRLLRPDKVLFTDENRANEPPQKALAHNVVDKDDFNKIADSLMLESVYRSKKRKARENAESEDIDSDDSDDHTEASEDVSEDGEDDSDS